MLQNRTALTVLAILVLTFALALVLGRQRPQPAPQAPTPDLAKVRTQAVGTFAANLTGTALAMPTSTVTDTPVPTLTGVATDAVSPTPSCYRMQFIRDVSIPDNTPMTPAQVFTKTWLVQNNGICAWRPGFQLILIGGLAMGGSPFTVESTVNPGARVEVSIKMVAPPNQTGIVQGTWRMSDQNGALFGDALTVVIVVGSETGVAPTGVSTPTP